MIRTALDHKVVLVTGANNPHGIGAAVAKAFAAEGANVFIHYLRSGQSQETANEGPGEAFYHSQQAMTADGVLKFIRDLGRKACAWEADLSGSGVASQLFNEAEKALGPVSVLVNNAAYWEGDTFVPAGAELANKQSEAWTDHPRAVSAQTYNRILM
jgi:3-oxoacyl-[acyl-carrier protein] reductase